MTAGHQTGMSIPHRGITPGLPTNTGSFKTTEKADSGLHLRDTDGTPHPVPAWFTMPETTEQTAEPLKELSLQTENRIAREAARLVNDGQLLLDPPYQRGSVWTPAQRRNLVKSWLQGIPVPPITLNDRASTGRRFAHNHPDLAREFLSTGRGSYACVDGKQRLETAVAWFNGEFGVPASWFPEKEIETTVETPDGPYVTYEGLTQAGQTHMGFHAKLPWSVAHLPSIEDEADLYLLVNTGGTDQTEADLSNAAQFSSASARSEGI